MRVKLGQWGNSQLSQMRSGSAARQFACIYQNVLSEERGESGEKRESVTRDGATMRASLYIGVR
jgi:hypothetical protein